ncbi:MAG: DEAD/DEAH box helicase [Pacificimonas sp.]|jgi:ATP-dependent RNA helicase RhlE|nr:DEAD/DEAH box helicase [Pacificimonas sp.]
MTKFSDFNLHAPIAKAVASEGYETPTPIQVQAIPPAMEGRDLLGIAQTGTGKTAAFALPILHQMATQPYSLKPKCPRVLVLAPTRELATQIGESFISYGRGMRLNVLTIFGGVKDGPQKRKLAAGVDVLIATPGRLLDLIDQRALDLGRIEFLVLDEADQMLDLGFIHALRRIVPMVPKDRQTLFFSATMPKQISELVGKYLTNPVKVEVQPQATTAERVEQRCTFVNMKEKQALLTLTLERIDHDRVLVFSRTKHGADRIVRNLEGARIRAAAIHGNKSQAQRERALGAFKDGHCRVLVATDIAARGIDVTGVSHVINFDIPEVPEQYVHRIGRTARAGADGEAISFVAPPEKGDWKAIEKVTRQRIAVEPLPENFNAEVERIGQIKLPPKGASGEERRGGGRDAARGDRRSRGGANGGGQRRRRPDFAPEREERGGRGPRPNPAKADGQDRGERGERQDRRADGGNRGPSGPGGPKRHGKPGGGYKGKGGPRGGKPGGGTNGGGGRPGGPRPHRKGGGRRPEGGAPQG